MVDEALLHSNNWFNFKEFYQFIAGRLDFHVFVEVGVWKGHSLIYLAQELHERPAQLYAVDLWNLSHDTGCGPEVAQVYELYQTNVLRAGVRDLITDVQADSTAAAELFQDGSCDFVFLDADHHYEKIKADIAAWRMKVRPGGILAGHDYANDCGVKRAVDEAFEDPRQAPGRVWYVDC